MADPVSLFPELDETVPDESAGSSSLQAHMDTQRYALAAEYLVAAELCLMGYGTAMSSEGSKYDLIADAEQGLRRVQVKCNMRARVIHGGSHARQGYILSTSNAGGKAKRNRDAPVEERYLGRDCDLFAFVAMDVQRSLFIDPFYLRKTAHFFHVTDLTEEKCELSREVVLKCLGPPLSYS